MAWIREFSIKAGDAFDGGSAVVEYSYLYREFYKRAGPIKGAKATTYPPVMRGEIVPVLGYIYRANVQDCGELLWVSDKDLPTGLAPSDRSSLFVPLQRKGVGGLFFGNAGSSLRCIKITPGKGRDPKDGPTAELDYCFLNDPKAVTSSVTVRAGDLAVLPEWGGFIVRRVVAPDEKGRVIGWVELSATGMSEDEIKKANNTVVRVEISKK